MSKKFTKAELAQPVHLSELHRAKIAESMKGLFAGTLNNFYGKHHTRKSRAIMAKKRIEWWKAHPNYRRKTK